MTFWWFDPPEKSLDQTRRRALRTGVLDYYIVYCWSLFGMKCQGRRNWTLRSPAFDPARVQNQMRDPPVGAEPLLRSHSRERSATDSSGDRRGAKSLPAFTPASFPSPSDPSRQAKRLPIRIVKMLTAHSGHLLHPEYLQPLTSAPVSIEVRNKLEKLIYPQSVSTFPKPQFKHFYMLMLWK